MPTLVFLAESMGVGRVQFIFSILLTNSKVI